MAVRVTVRVDLNNTQRRLMKMRDIDFSEPLRNSGTYMEGAIGRRFRSGGGSRPWKPLSATTLKIHPHRVGGKPLNDTGRLRGSVTAGATKDVRGDRLYYSWGSNVKYAGMQNFGGTTSWGTKIPAREFLYFDPADERAIKRIFEDFVEGLVND
jgi:phage gpG-like protein